MKDRHRSRWSRNRCGGLTESSGKIIELDGSGGRRDEVIKTVVVFIPVATDDGALGEGARRGRRWYLGTYEAEIGYGESPYDEGLEDADRWVCGGWEASIKCRDQGLDMCRGEGASVLTDLIGGESGVALHEIIF